MTQTEILEEFRQLSFKQQMEVVEAAIRILHKNFQQIDLYKTLANDKDHPPKIGNSMLLDEQAEEPEVSLASDWLVASSSSLQEVWDNEADAIYDQL